MVEKDDRLLTVPSELEDPSEYVPTGNEYVSLPLLQRQSLACDRVNVLLMNPPALLEFAGIPDRPFLSVVFRWADGRQAIESSFDSRLVLDWIPQFRSETEDGLVLTATFLAPLEEKGFLVCLEVENRGSEAVEILAGLTGCWSACLETTFTAREVQGARQMVWNEWIGGASFRLMAGGSVASLAIRPSEPLHVVRWWAEEFGLEGVENGKAFSSTGLEIPSGELVAGSGEDPLHYLLGRVLQVPRGEGRSLVFYCAVGKDPDGAGTTAVHLARRGWDDLSRDLVSFLKARSRLTADPRLTSTLNRNLFFNYFFSQGYTLDTEELALVTSRSPRYYVSAAFWARDSLLWSFPGILLVEPSRARETLLAAYTRYIRNAGVHSLYLDGTVLYPGFELDELCAYLIALEFYLDKTGDLSILDEGPVIKGVPYLERLLKQRRHAEAALYETFLYPSDDPAVYPYLIYNNVLVWRCFLFLARLEYRRRGPRGPALQREAAAIRRAIDEFCVVDGTFGPMFAWAVDLEGNHVLYDEPPGSLQLLPYYGFCSFEDERYLNTVRWIRSRENPYYYGEEPFPGAGCPHAPHPFVMDLFNLLLSGRAEEATRVLSRAPLDGGLACETYDRITGRVKTGAAFATCAGFLAYALDRAHGSERGLE